MTPPRKRLVFLSAFCVLVLAVCIFVGVRIAGDSSGPRHKGGDGLQERAITDSYVEIRKDSSGRLQMLITKDVWKGIVSHDGFGGYTHTVRWLGTFDGKGDTYKDPEIYENPPPAMEINFRGEVIIDLDRRVVVMDLYQVPVPGGEGRGPEASSLTGTYKIKKFNQYEFSGPASYTVNLAK